MIVHVGFVVSIIIPFPLLKLAAVFPFPTTSVHLFAAIFGGTFSMVSYCNKNEIERISTSIHLGSDHNSILFSLFGSLIIIPYWPSFNTALVDGNQKYRGIINTYCPNVWLLIIGSVV